MILYKEAHALKIEAFIDSIINDKPTSVNKENVLKSLNIAIAASESAEKGKPVFLG